MQGNQYINNKKCCNNDITYHGPTPFAVNISQAARQNCTYRTALWTGCHLQMTLMCIPPCGDIGLEVHPDNDQYIRIEEGKCIVKIGCSIDRPEMQQELCLNDAVFIPAGTWHNIINIGSCPLKLSTIYAPPHHPRETIHITKQDAEKSNC
ncbi:MAG: cupin domain-containing protein [Clostridia bacterium]